MDSRNRKRVNCSISAATRSTCGCSAKPKQEMFKHCPTTLQVTIIKLQTGSSFGRLPRLMGIKPRWRWRNCGKVTSAIAQSHELSRKLGSREKKDLRLPRTGRVETAKLHRAV